MLSSVKIELLPDEEVVVYGIPYLQKLESIIDVFSARCGPGRPGEALAASAPLPCSARSPQLLLSGESPQAVTLSLRDSGL